MIVLNKTQTNEQKLTKKIIKMFKSKLTEKETNRHVCKLETDFFIGPC